MLKKIRNYASEFNTYSKKLKIHMLCTVLSFFILTLIVTFIFNYFYKRENNERICDYISKSCATNDMRIETQLREYLYNNLEKYMRPSSFSLFYDKTDNDKDFFAEMRISIIDDIRLKQYISNLSLYRTYDNAVISALYNGYTMEGLSTDYDDIKSILALGEITTPYFYISAVDQTVTYVYPVINPNKWQGDYYRGFAVLRLSDPGAFFHTSISSYNPSGTFLVLCDNAVLCSEGINTLSDEVILEMINTSPDQAIMKQKVLSMSYTYYYNYSSVSNLMYIYYEPIPSFLNYLHNANYLKLYSLVIITIFLLCTIRFMTLMHNQQIRKRTGLITAEYADTLMQLNSPTGVDLVIQKYLSLEAFHKYYSVLIVELDVVYLSDLTEKRKDILREEFREIAKKQFRSHKMPNIVSLQYNGHISCIINYGDNRKIKDIAYQLSEEFQKYNKCSFNIFYTEAYTDITDAFEAYKDLVQLMKYSFLYNYSNIFSYQDLKRYEANTQIIEPKVIETVIGYLNDLNPSKLIEYLKNALIQIRSNGYSYSQSIDFFNLVFCALKDFFIEKSVYYKLENVPLAEQLSKFNNLEECISFIEASLNAYRENFLSNSTPTNRKYIESILLYIDNNIQNVTLSSVADYYHVTSAHLCRIFKDSVGVNFSEYVSEKKLLKAAELLKSNPNLSIIEVAASLGYNTPSYFSSKFKEHFKITPGAYRKAVLNNKTDLSSI